MAHTLGFQFLGFARRAAVAFAAVALVAVCFVLGLVLDVASLAGGGHAG